MPLTLTPELRLYLLTGLGLCALASLNLAGAVHNRYLDRRGTPMLPVHVGLCAAVTAGGALVQGRGVLWRTAPALTPTGRLSAAVAAGVVVALVAAAGDAGVLRVLGRRTRVHARSGSPGRPAAGGRAPKDEGTQKAPDAREARDVREARKADGAWRPSRRDRQLPTGPAWTLAAAVLEETAFRGVWYDLAVRAPNTALRLAELAAGVMAFGLAHLFFGWNQVLAKLPLALAATAAVAVTGTVLAPVLGHGLFNLRAWLRYRAALRAREAGPA